MTVGILLITHPQVGKTLLATASSLLSGLSARVEVLDVPLTNCTEPISQQASTLCTKLDDGTGVLILTDLYGSTPDNIAGNLLSNDKVRVVSGINLPMLIKVLNYYHLPLTELAEKAISGGRNSVLQHNI